MGGGCYGAWIPGTLSSPPPTPPPDHDECAEGTHGCSGAETCVNTFGGHRCVPRELCRAPYTPHPRTPRYGLPPPGGAPIYGGRLPLHPTSHLGDPNILGSPGFWGGRATQVYMCVAGGGVLTFLPPQDVHLSRGGPSLRPPPAVAPPSLLGRPQRRRRPRRPLPAAATPRDPPTPAPTGGAPRCLPLAGTWGAWGGICGG